MEVIRIISEVIDAGDSTDVVYNDVEYSDAVYDTGEGKWNQW